MSVNATRPLGGKAAPGRSVGAPTALRVSDPPEVRRAWMELSPIQPDRRVMAQNRIVTATRSDTGYIAVDILRTKVMKTMREKGWTRLALTSPSAGCGKSTLALNLAFSLARQSALRLLLLDLDLRAPQIARLLGCRQAPAIEAFLHGRATMRESLLRLGDGFAVAPNSTPVANPAELLHELTTSTFLADISRRLGLELIIIDLPPMLANDDVLAILPAIDGVLLVAGAEQSGFNEIDVCERDLAQEDKLVGVVLNKCRFDPAKYGY